MKVKKRIDKITVSFIIFFSIIFVFWTSSFLLFNILKIKDLNLNKSVFASTEIDTDMLGFSDMTLSEFIKIFQSISSPEENKILEYSPQKKDIIAVFSDLNKNGLTEDNLTQKLSGDFYGINNMDISQRGICVISDILIRGCNTEEYNNIIGLCGENSIDIDSIKLYKDDNKYFADVVLCINIENIRNKILENFGYPIFEICGKLYINNTYELNTVDNKISGNVLSSSIYGIDNEDSDKLINALFVAYYLSPTESKYVIDYEKLSPECLDAITFGINNLGSIKFESFSLNDAIVRKDIKDQELIINVF